MNTGMRILGSMKAFASYIGVEGEACDYALDSNCYHVNYSGWSERLRVEYHQLYITNEFFYPLSFVAPTIEELIFLAWAAYGSEAEFGNIFCYQASPMYQYYDNFKKAHII